MRELACNMTLCVRGLPPAARLASGSVCGAVGIFSPVAGGGGGGGSGAIGGGGGGDQGRSAANGGGGAGSSFAMSDATDVTTVTASTSGDGSVQVTYTVDDTSCIAPPATDPSDAAGSSDAAPAVAVTALPSFTGSQRFDVAVEPSGRRRSLLAGGIEHRGHELVLILEHHPVTRAREEHRFLVR